MLYWLLFLSLLTRLLPLDTPNAQLRQALARQNHPSQLRQVPTPQGHSLAYLEMGSLGQPPLLLIHGSPGGMENWQKLMETTSLAQNYHLLLIDRPGYGATTQPGGSLALQSKALAPLLKRHCPQGCYLAGHSYGGALALQVAADYPQRIKAVVSLAGTISARYQERRWYNYLLRFTPLRWLVHPTFMVSNREMWRLPQDLQVLSPRLSEITSRVALLQGGQDFLAHPRSPRAVLPQLTQAHTRLFYRPSAGHFVIWTQPEWVVAAFRWAFSPGVQPSPPPP